MNTGLTDNSGYGGMIFVSNKTQVNKTSSNGTIRPGSNSPSNPLHILAMNQEPVIKEVWEDNFEDEIKNLMNLIEKYNIIGMVKIISAVAYFLRTQNSQVLFTEPVISTAYVDIFSFKREGNRLQNDKDEC